MRDEEERADPSAVECEFAYTDLCSWSIQWGLEQEFVARWLALQCCVSLVNEESHVNAVDRGDRVESVRNCVYSISNR